MMGTVTQRTALVASAWALVGEETGLGPSACTVSRGGDIWPSGVHDARREPFGILLTVRKKRGRAELLHQIRIHALGDLARPSERVAVVGAPDTRIAEVGSNVACHVCRGSRATCDVNDLPLPFSTCRICVTWIKCKMCLNTQHRSISQPMSTPGISMSGVT